MNVAFQRNIGGFITPLAAVNPQAASAGTINGSAIDRFKYNLPQSCVVQQMTGLATGSPTTIGVQTKTQHSPDGSTWSDYVQPGDSSVTQTDILTAENGAKVVAVNLSSAARFFRAVTTTSFTGGTSPTIEVATAVILGGEARN
jgi:hypothetical protein